MSMKVVIADPDWRFAAQATGYLESHAHHVVNQPRRQDAVACIRHWQPDLVILSAELAEDGAMFREIRSLPSCPAILLTEHVDRYDRAWRAWQQGGDELLMKPVFKAEELRNAIVAAMENATAGTIARPRAASA